MPDQDALLFFQQRPQALPLYTALEERLLAALPDTRIRVGKTQITFANRRVFACASFLPVRRAAERPEVYLTVTFGLDHRQSSPRIDGAVQPYPGRWTHHVLVSAPAEIDDQLLAWLAEAAAFSAGKR